MIFQICSLWDLLFTLKAADRKKASYSCSPATSVSVGGRLRKTKPQKVVSKMFFGSIVYTDSIEAERMTR